MPIKPRESLPYSPARFAQTIRRFFEPMVRWIRFRVLGRRRSEMSEQWQEKLRSFTPVFVYQMGKVASTSVFESLKRQYPGCVFHGHYFSANHSDLEIRSLFKYAAQSHYKLKIISLVRDPVSRNISAFFQNFKRDTGTDVKQCNKSMLQLRDMFLKNYPHEIPWVWFDNNIKKHFGIDVYEYPFPKSGHITIQEGPVELLLMKHDLDDSLKQELVGAFVGNSKFEINRSNVSAEKDYCEYLDAFKKLKMPLWYLHRVCSSRYTQHFYYHEIVELIDAWQEPGEQAA